MLRPDLQASFSKLHGGHGFDDIDVASLGNLAVFHPFDSEVGLFGQEVGHEAAMVGREVLHDDERQSAFFVRRRNHARQGL